LGHAPVRLRAGAPKVIERAQDVVEVVGRIGETREGGVDDLAGREPAHQATLEEVLLAPSPCGGGSWRDADGALVLEQSLEHADRGVERPACGAVLLLAVPSTVGHRLAQQPIDDALHVLAEVGAEGDGPAIDAGLDFALEERLAGVLPATVLADERDGAPRFLAL